MLSWHRQRTYTWPQSSNKSNIVENLGHLIIIPWLDSPIGLLYTMCNKWAFVERPFTPRVWIGGSLQLYDLSKWPIYLHLIIIYISHANAVYCSLYSFQFIHIIVNLVLKVMNFKGMLEGTRPHHMSISYCSPQSWWQKRSVTKIATWKGFDNKV